MNMKKKNPKFNLIEYTTNSHGLNQAESKSSASKIYSHPQKHPLCRKVS